MSSFRFFLFALVVLAAIACTTAHQDSLEESDLLESPLRLDSEESPVHRGSHLRAAKRRTCNGRPCNSKGNSRQN